MNVVVNFLLIIDGLVFLMVILDSISKKEPRKLMENQRKITDKLNNKKLDEIENEKSKSGKISLCIGSIIGGFIFFVIITSIITVPIILWFVYGFYHAFLGYVIINLFLSIYILRLKIVKIGIENLRESQPVFVVVSNLFRILLLIVCYFGWKTNFQESMIKIYENFNHFNYIFVVLYPVVLIGLVITNIYALLNGMLLLSKNQPMNNDWRTNLKDILLIFVISSFVGLIYLSDDNLTFVKSTDINFIYQNIEIVKILLTAIFIPLLFDKIFSSRREKTESLKPLTIKRKRRIYKKSNKSFARNKNSKEYKKN